MDKYIPGMHMKQPKLHVVHVSHIQKTKKDYKNLQKQDIK